MSVFGRKTELSVSCLTANCSGSVKLFMTQIVVIHKVIHIKKKIVRKLIKERKSILVAMRGFNIAKGKTVLLPLFLNPFVARMITPKRKIVLMGLVLEAKQKPLQTRFVLRHGIIKKTPVKKGKLLSKKKK